MKWTLDMLEQEEKRAKAGYQAAQQRGSYQAPTASQVNAAAQATMSQNQAAPSGGSLVEQATNTAPRTSTLARLPGIHDNTARRIDRLQNRMQANPQDDTAERIRSLEQQAINYSNAGMTEQMLQVQKELDELRQSSDQGKLDALEAQRAEEKAAAWQAEQDKRMQDYVNLQAEEDFSTLAGQGMSADGWSKEELDKRISETDMEISKLIASGQFEEADDKKKELDFLYKMKSMGKYGENAERDTYSYLLAKDAQTGSNEAQEYLKFMENTMNYRQGKEQAEKIQGIESDVLRTLAIGAHGVASGMANAGAGYNQLLNGDEPIATSPMQYASQEIQEDLGKVGKLLYGASSSVGNMLPSILLSAATGGLGASAAVAGGIGAAAMGASSAGNTYTQAVKEGYSPEQAKTYAALVGASEATLQYLLGGIGKLGGVTDDVLLAKVSKLDNALARVAMTGAVKLGSEIGEEELQLYLEPLIKSVVFGEEYKKPGFDEMLETALVTALSTGALEGKAILSAGKNTNAPQQTQTNTPNEDMVAKMAQDIVDPHNIKSSASTNASGVRSLVNATKEQIKTFVNNAFNNKNTFQFLRISQANNDLVQKVGSAGINIEGYVHALRDNDLRHIRKSHGDLSTNKYQVTETDLENVANIIENYDELYIGYDTKDGNRTIVYEKTIGPKTFYVEEILSDGVLSTKQMLKTGAKSKPSFLKKYKKITDGSSDTDVPLEAESTGRSPLGNHVQDAEETVSSNNNIPTNPENVNGSVGDMGAKTSDFPHEVKESQSKTTPEYYEKNNIPEEGQADNHYTARTWAETKNNARIRLEQDYNGERENLANKTTWSDEEMAEGEIILEDIRKKAEETGDWSEHRRWSKVFNQHKEEAGRALAYLGSLNKDSKDGILADAAVALENAKSGTDTNAVMQEVDDYANRYDAAAEHEDIDGLVQIIKDCAITRHTASLFGNKFSKVHNWALDRIAGYAKQAATDTGGKLDTGGKSVQKSFKVGDTVQALDRNNFGKIEKVNEDGTYDVHFVSPTGGEATVTFNGKDLVDPRAKTPSSGSIRTTTGAAYEFLKHFAANSIRSIANDYQKVEAGQIALTIRRNSLLNKAATVFRNFGGNGTFNPIDSIAKSIAVPLDQFLSSKTGTRSVFADKNTFSKESIQGGLDGLAMSLLSTGLDVDADMSSPYTSSRTFKMSGGIVSKLLSTWERNIAYRMVVPDEVSKGSTEARVQAPVDKAYIENKIKDDSLKDAGRQEALYRTFQGDSKLAQATGDVKRGMNRWEFKGAGVGDFLLPFSQVGSNLASVAGDYSPISMIAGLKDLHTVLKDAKSGTLTAKQQADAVKRIGRGFTGGMLVVAATALARVGVLHVLNPGGDEESKNKTASDKAQGKDGTQLNLSALGRWLSGEDPTWRDDDDLESISYLEPLNALLTIGAMIAEDMELEGKLTAKNVFNNSIDGTIQAVLDLPLLDTFKDISNAVEYSKEETVGGKGRDAAASLIAESVPSFIPNSLRGLAQAVDPYQRDLYSKDTLVGQTVDQVLGSIPFASRLLPRKQDVYGNDVKNEDFFKNFLNNTVAPGKSTTFTETELQAALNALYEETGDASVYLSETLPEYVTTDEGRVNLSYDQQRQFNSARGDAYDVASAALENDKNYQQVSGDFKLKAYAFAEDYANQIARASLDIGYEPDTWVSELEGASPEEIAKVIVGKALDSVGGYGDQATEDMYRKQIYDPTWSVMDGEVLDKAMEYATAFNDAEAKERMGYEMDADWMLEAKSMGIHAGRTDYFIGKAVETMAKKVGDGKYDGLEKLLESGEINGKAALLAMPDGAVDAYNEYCAGKYVSAEDWVDVYGYLNSLDGSSSENKKKALEYIDGLKMTPRQKTALAQAVYAANPDYYRSDAKIPTDWLLKHGDTDAVIAQFSESQEELYAQHIKGSKIDMGDYLDIWSYRYGSGGEVKHDQEEVVAKIKASGYDRDEQIRIFLAVGYSKNSIKKFWK